MFMKVFPASMQVTRNNFFQTVEILIEILLKHVLLIQLA